MANLTELCINANCSNVQNLTPGDGIAISDSQVISAARNPANTYTKDEVNALIGSLEGVSMQFVDMLPTTGEDNVIYLVPNGGSAPNIYDEYVWVNGAWETIGDTQIDMSDYMRKDQMLNWVWPVGSYYETSNTSFNPNTAWGGTWELESEGKVHIGAGSTYANGSTGGEATVTLTANQSGNQSQTINTGNMSANASHSHTPTNNKYMFLEIEQSWNGGVYLQTDRRVAPTNSSGTFYLMANKTSYTSGATALDKATIATSTQHTHSVTVAAKNAIAAHNNMQPYIAVNRWHRTA